MQQMSRAEAARREAEYARRWQEGLERGKMTIYTTDGEAVIQPRDLRERLTYYGRDETPSQGHRHGGRSRRH
jgi:hypothetical protein